MTAHTTTARIEAATSTDDFAIGAPVEAGGRFGKVCGAKSTIMFPGGIYPVEHIGPWGEPQVLWRHAADLKRVTVQ